MRRLVAAVFALVFAGNAAAQDHNPECAPALRDWAESCGDGYTLRFCDGPTLVFDVATDSSQSESGVLGRVELRQVGAEVRASIVGANGPLSEQRVEIVEAQRELLRCAELDFPISNAVRGSTQASRPTTKLVSLMPVWLWALFLSYCAFVLGYLLRLRRAGRVTAALSVIIFVCALLRLQFSPTGFLHHNGQGPLWIRFALGEASPYGPGYRWIYALVSGDAPEASVFLRSQALVALAMASAFLLFCLLGVRRWVSLFAVAILILDPALSRVASSESYYASCFALLTFAGTALVTTLRSSQICSSRWRLALTSAGVPMTGFLLSCSIAVHPIAWPFAACVPLLAAPALSSHRRRNLVIVFSVCALTLGFSIPIVVRVLSGPLGSWATDPMLREGSEFAAPAMLVLTLLAGLAWFSKRPTSAALTAGGAFVPVVLCLSVGLSIWPPPLAQALYRLGLVVTLPLVLFLTGNVRRHQVLLTCALIAGGAAYVLLNWSAFSEVATDAQEQAWLIERRSELPAEARVHTIRRLEEAHEGEFSRRPVRVFELPFYSALGHPSALDIDQNTRQPGDYLFLGSLCSTEAGRARCDELRRGTTLIDSASFDAIESYIGFDFLNSEIRVELRRIDE